MKKSVFTVLLTLFVLCCYAQESQNAYNFLRLPVSAHAAALGGENITLVEDDATLIFHNPSLIQNVSDNSMNLNMMTYMRGTITASASFVKAWGSRATWGVSGRYMDYGKMKEINAQGEETGTFGARDIALAGTFSYGLTEHLSGGITAKLAASYMGNYNSLAVLVDIGLNYWNEDSEWSLSAVAKNLGGQLKAFEDDFERMPLDVQIGVSKIIPYTPIRLSVTMTRLNDWKFNFWKHFVLGADVMLGHKFYVAAGFNPLRFSEMKISDGENESAHWAGFSIGAGMQLERLKLHVAYAKYHVSTASLLINLSYSL